MLYPCSECAIIVSCTQSPTTRFLSHQTWCIFGSAHTSWCGGRYASLEDRYIVRHHSCHSIQLPDGIVIHCMLLSQGCMMVLRTIASGDRRTERWNREVWSMTALRSALSHCVYFGLQKLQKASDFATIFATSVAKWPQHTTIKTDISRSWPWYIFIV